MTLLRGDYRILRVLSDEKPRRFTEILNESELSRPVVSDYLKRLMLNEDIEVHDRKYVITERGKSSLEKMLIVKKAQGLPAQRIRRFSLPLSHRLRAELREAKYARMHLPTMQEIPTTVEVLFFLNRENRDRLDEFDKYLERLAIEVSTEIAETIATKKYGKHPLRHWFINWGRLDRIKESFEWSRIFTSVECGVLIYFEPAGQTDWERELKLAQRADGVFNMHILDYYADPKLRRDHLKLMIRWQIAKTKQLEQLPFEIAFWGKSPEEVRSKILSVKSMITENAKGTLYQPTNSEIKESLEEMERDEEIVIEPVYVPKLKPIAEATRMDIELIKEETKPPPTDKQLEKQLKELIRIRKQLEEEVEELMEVAIKSGELEPHVRSLSIEEKYNKVIHLKSFAP